jgi:DNA-directed RNA polymerase specialized sigma24 family protein
MRAEVVDEGYEAFFRAHAEEFASFLAGVLGSEADVRGGRAGVADALQEAMLRILREWGELEDADADERARRLYRCLRDAAGEALRREHGRRNARRRRPTVVAYDFGALEADGESLEPRERELTVAVLGAMVRDLADDLAPAERRVLLDRGVLLAGLRALSECEAVALIAVDRLGWEQRELADHLGMEFGRLRETLFHARRLFYGVVRHAVGVEVDEQERARLHAYLAGELVGRDRRLARRHLLHCQACQALVREQQRFTAGAHQLLAPLPFVLGGQVLAKPAAVKGAAVAATPAATGLFAQAGAAKALAATVALLGTGLGVDAWLSVNTDERPVGAIAALPASAQLMTRLATDKTPRPAGARRSASSPTTRRSSTSRRSQQHRSAGATKRSSRSPSAPASTTASQATSSPGIASSSGRSSAAAGGAPSSEFGFERP